MNFRSAQLKKFSILSLALAAMVPAQASATRFSIVGVDTISTPNVDPSSLKVNGVDATLGTSGASAFGGGALLGFAMAPAFEFETGALYITRKYDMTIAAAGVSQTSTQSQHAVEIPALLRYHVAHYFSVGAGGYAAIGTGNVKTTGPSGTVTSSTYASAGLKNRDYGVLFSAALHIPVSTGASFLVDGRYSMGLTDVNADSKSLPVEEKYNDIQVLAGLQFHLGSK